MASILRGALALTGVVFAFVACGAEPADDADVAATIESPYVIWQRSSACLIHKTNAPTIRMCVTGNGDLVRAKQLTEFSLLTWLDALRPIAPNATKSIVFTCTSPDGYLTIANNGEYSYAGNVFVNSNSAKGTYLHEFGHAFACLGDTYVGRTAGACQAGQPHSIMCDGLLRTDLSSDDVTGVRVQYQAMVSGGGTGSTTPGDADGDGVPDASDRCPNTPAGSHVWLDQYNGYWKGCAGGQVPIQ